MGDHRSPGAPQGFLSPAAAATAARLRCSCAAVLQGRCCSFQGLIHPRPQQELPRSAAAAAATALPWAAARMCACTERARAQGRRRPARTCWVQRLGWGGGPGGGRARHHVCVLPLSGRQGQRRADVQLRQGQRTLRGSTLRSSTLRSIAWAAPTRHHSGRGLRSAARWCGLYCRCCRLRWERRQRGGGRRGAEHGGLCDVAGHDGLQVHVNVQHQAQLLLCQQAPASECVCVHVCGCLSACG